MCFLMQSAEAIEDKGVVFLVSAKKCKRVHKSLKRRRLDDGGRKLNGRNGKSRRGEATFAMVESYIA